MNIDSELHSNERIALAEEKCIDCCRKVLREFDSEGTWLGAALNRYGVAGEFYIVFIYPESEFGYNALINFGVIDGATEYFNSEEKMKHIFYQPKGYSSEKIKLLYKKRKELIEKINRETALYRFYLMKLLETE